MLGAVVFWTGAARVFEIMARPAGAVVLMYHSVSGEDTAQYIDPGNRIAPELFERQMAYLSNHRRVTSFSNVVEQIAAGTTLPAGTVCVTFDDGYLDNLTVAAPILAKYKLPATLFLATGYVERGEPQWADVLHWLFQCRSSEILKIPSLGHQASNLASATTRAAVKKSLHTYLLEATHSERQRLLQEIERQVVPKGVAPRLTLNWDDVRTLHRRYPFFDIGGHTRGHIDLQKHRDETARSEISGCAEDIRRELGFTPRHFSFPYGRWCDETREIVRASGWQSAVGISTSIRVDRDSDRFAIPRVEAPQGMTGLRFMTSGAYPGVLSILKVG